MSSVALNSAAPAAAVTIPRSHARILGIWLIVNCAMVLAMAVIGAITRLTESGLSITVWEPLLGWRWPMSEAAWQEALDFYRATPYYQAVFAGMAIEQFKVIFFWEWFHRLWGRLIGLTYALPLLVFFALRMVPAGLRWKLLGLLALGGLQAFMGWFMVQSGLVDRPSVSHFRLAMHLGLALLIFALMWRLALDLLWPRPAPAAVALGGLQAHTTALLALLAVTIAWGAFTAGLDAGMIYGTFPLMGGQLWPPETAVGGLLAVVEQPAWVQFTHRWLGVTTAVVALWLWLRGRSRMLDSTQRRALWAVALIAAAQMSLGIFTVISVVAIPLAAAHQAGAILLIAAALWLRHALMGQAPAERAV